MAQAFSVVFNKAIDRAEAAEDVKARVTCLIDCITYSVFIYTARGLFERDKLTFTAQLAFQVRNNVGSMVATNFEPTQPVWNGFT